MGRTAAPAWRSSPPSLPPARAPGEARLPRHRWRGRGPARCGGRSRICLSCRVLPCGRCGSGIGQPEIGAADPVVRQQCLVGAVEHHVPGLQHIAMIGQFQRLGNTLFDQQDGDAVLAMDLRDALEDRVGDRRARGPSRVRRASAASAPRPGRGRSPASAARRPTACRQAGWRVRPGSGTACGCVRACDATARGRPLGRRPSRGSRAPSGS